MPTKDDPDDDRSTCRICGKPIEPREARYREEAGDVHVACHDREQPPRPQPSAGEGVAE